jgi:heat shock protein HspQ
MSKFVEGQAVTHVKHGWNGTVVTVDGFIAGNQQYYVVFEDLGYMTISEESLRSI